MAELRTTPLHTVHLESGAKMMPFSGWDMPADYSGLIADHQAGRRGGPASRLVRGRAAPLPVRRAARRRAASARVGGQPQSSARPLPSGCPVDDVIVYRRAA